MKSIPSIFFLTTILITIAFTLISPVYADSEKTPVKIGWIGAISGPVQKFGAHQAALIAQDQVNSTGGINGRPLKLIFEDGQCNGRHAVTAANKLIHSDHVKFILGGHCSPESSAIAPLAKRAGILILGAITTTPKLAIADDNFYRLSPVSTKVADKLAPYAVKSLKLKRFGVIHAETDYAAPPAIYFAELIRELGQTVTEIISFTSGETDFRSMLLRFKRKPIDALYIGTQSPESAALILRQLHDFGLNPRLFGNEVTGTAGFRSAGAQQKLFEGLIYAEPNFDLESIETRNLIKKFKTRFNVDALPFGLWTAEAYDTVVLLSKLIAKCGEEVEQVAACLSKLKNYGGASGIVSMDRNGDGIRKYIIKQIRNQQIIALPEE